MASNTNSTSGLAISAAGKYSVTFTWATATKYMICINNTNSSHYKLNSVKLEIGNVATSFVPPNPATELVKCQRYFVGGAFKAVPTLTETKGISHATLYLPCMLRTLPNNNLPTLTGTWTAHKQSNNAIVDSAVQIWSLRGNSVGLAVSGTTESVYIITDNGGISADLL